MTINPTEILNDFFLKVLTVQKSIQAINDSWLDNVNLSVANHHFTDPINQDIQDDKEQVEHFNKLFNTSYTEIKWAKKVVSNCQIVINENNKANISKEFLSNIYCQLSVTIFEHNCLLLKALLQSQSSKSINIINEFDREFREQLIAIDEQKIIKTPTIFLLHNLRLFRNCITHSGGAIHELEESFKVFNQQIENEKKFESLQFYGTLKKENFCYSVPMDSGYIQLNNASFLNLLDLYSQIAYLTYLCYCRKFNLQQGSVS